MSEKSRWAKLAGLPEPINERFGEIKVMDRGDHLLIRGLYSNSPNTAVRISPTNGLTMDDVNNWRDELIKIAQQKSKNSNIDWSAGIFADEDGKPTVGTPRGGTDEPYYIFSSNISGKGQQLNENIGGVVSIGAINNLFDREKEKYEDAFEHYLAERYEDKNLEEAHPLETEPGFEDKYQIGVLTQLIKYAQDELAKSRNNISDEAISTAEETIGMLQAKRSKHLSNLKNIATQGLEEYANPVERPEHHYTNPGERDIVHKVIDGVRNDFSREEMSTREYIDAIIAALEEIKTTDF